MRRKIAQLILCSIIAVAGCGDRKGNVKQTTRSYQLVTNPKNYVPISRLRWSGSYVVAQYLPALEHFGTNEGLLLTLGPQSAAASAHLPPGDAAMAVLDRDAVVISPARGKGVIGYRLPSLERLELPPLPAWDVFPTDQAGMIALLSRDSRRDVLVYRHVDRKTWRLDCKGNGLDVHGFIVTGDRVALSGDDVIREGSEYKSGDRIVTQLWSLDDKTSLMKEFSHDDHAYGNWQHAVLLGDRLFAVTTEFGKYQVADLNVGESVYELDTKIPESEFRDGHGQAFRLIGGRWVEATGRFFGLEHRSGSKTITLVAYDLKTGRELQRRTGIPSSIDDVVVCFDGKQWNAMLEVKGQDRVIVSVADIEQEVAVLEVPPPSDYSLLYTGKQCVIVTPDGFAHIGDLAPSRGK